MPDPTVIMDKIVATPREDPDTQQDIVVYYHYIADLAPAVWQSDYPKDVHGDTLLADIEGDIGETFA